MTQPWHANYEEGIPAEVNVTEYKNVNEIMEKSFKKFKNRDSFHCMGKGFTYGELDTLTKKFASYLQNDLGLEAGARVALMMPNILQYPVALFGALRAGMVIVNVNPLYTAKELEHQLNDSGAEAIVIFANSCSVLQSVIKRTKVKHVFTTQIGDMLGFPKSLIVNFVISKVKKMVPAWDLPGNVRFNTAVAKGDEATFKPVEKTLDDIAFLQYTGGTTGVSKGAVLTHGNICANMIQARTWISTRTSDKKQDIIITPLPLYHIFSLTANCMVFSSLGAKNILITNPRDMPGFVKELKKWKFTTLTGVNTLFNGLLNNPDFKDVDFSSLKICLGGGMAVQKAVATKWKEVTGVTLVEAYGLTETSPAACMNPMNLKDYNGMIGLPISSTAVKVLDDDENEVALGEPGEICIKGPQVMKGYYNREEATAEVFTKDGFLKTGDVAIQNEGGFFKIVDRKKDMILVSGFNVYPNEIEDAVVTHPGISECAAIGVPSEKSGEAVKLFVVKTDSALTSDEIIAHCKKHLTSYKVPKLIEFREDLPKTNVGKILRKDLRNKELAK